MNLLDLLVKIGVDDKASERIGAISGKMKSGLASAAKAGAAAVAAGVAAAGAGVVAIGKASLEAYANYEQLSGGVEKLFGEAADSVQKHAKEAYETSGMSANQYMQQVTSFSAALINSLGGDTAKAAEQADVAMRAISDNVNVFGSNMEDVQNAFQGFAKQNYTMLDNLKLGYGGTKTEMERLIADANEYAVANGKAADLSIDSFSDVVTAIELIQEKQHIAGTTAKEAATTIEGSLNMTKAAWENLLTEFGKDDGDVAARVTELVDSAMTAFDNIAPRIVTIISNIIDAIPVIVEQVTPYLEQIQAKFQEFVDAHQEELAAMAQMFWDGIVQALSLSIQMAFAALGQMFATLITTFPQWAPQLLQAAVMLFASIVQGIATTIPQVLNSLTHLLGDLIRYVTGYNGSLLQAAQNLFHNIGDGVTNMRQFIVSSVQNAIRGAIDSVRNFFGSAFDVGRNIIDGIVQGITNAPWAITDALWGCVDNAINSVKSWLGIASPSKLFAQFGRYTMDGFALGIDDEAEEPEKAMLGAAKNVYAAASGKIDFGMGSSLPTAQASGIMGGVAINIYDPVIRETADVDEIMDYIDLKMRRRMEQWSQLPSMA